MKIKPIKIPLIALVLMSLVFLILPLNQVKGEIIAEPLLGGPLFTEPELPREPSIPGRIEDTGTYFEIKDSEYLNVALKSSEEIKIVLESIPEMVTTHIESTSGATSSEIILSGFLALTTYYKYEDDYHNEVVFTTDEKGNYIYTQDLSQPHFVFIQPRAGTKYIKDDAVGGDCASIGNWDLPTKTCILTTDLFETVQIDNNNIILDCAGHKITGSKTGSGILVTRKHNITIKNCIVNNFYYGIYFLFSHYNILNNNTTNSNNFGIYLYESSNNELLTNQTLDNDYYGITLYNSQSNTLNSNIVKLNKLNYGIQIAGNLSKDNLITKNIVEENVMGIHLDSGTAGNQIVGNNILNNPSHGILLFGASNNFIAENIIEKNSTGVYLIYSPNNTFTANKIYSNKGRGIIFSHNSSDNTLKNNEISENQYNLGFYWWDLPEAFVQNIDTTNTINGKPIYYLVNEQNREIQGENVGFLGLVNSSNIKAENLNLTDNIYGLLLVSSQNSQIENSQFTNNYIGIHVINSFNNSFSDNKIFNNQSAVILNESSANVFLNNTIKSNDSTGLSLQHSENNLFYHNNFIDNKFWCGSQVYPGADTSRRFNHFDNGYPSGGNYWSDYIGQDLKSGSNQDQPSSDGIGDTPYNIKYYFWGNCIGSYQDRYPFIKENGWEGPPPPEENQPPTISNLDQYKSDGILSIAEGGTTTEPTVVFQATLSDPDNDKVKLQVESKEYGQQLNGQGIIESDFIDSGGTAQITRFGLISQSYHWRARAVDDKENTSAWQEFGASGNVDFEVKLVPLYTQVESDYPSRIATARWSIQKYGTGKYPDCWDDRLEFASIRRCGCAITSMVMLGRYYDINTAIDRINVDPGNINTWLTNNKGYTSNGSLWWSKAVEYLGFINETTGKKMARLDFNPKADFNVSSGSPRIDNFLASAKPIVARSKTFGHYFIIDGKLASTYTLKDPTWYNTKRLNQSKNLAEHIQGYNNYFDTANLFSYLEIPRPITASMYLHLASPAELLITDPFGRKLGKDPITGIVYEEIPDSIHTQEGPIVSSDTPIDPDEMPESKIIYISSPIDGEYDINVIGTDSGSYTLNLLVYDENGNSKDITIAGNTTVNNIQEFELSYSTSTIQQTEIYRIVDIDIKPGSDPNSINLKSEGLVPVAVLTNNFFDAKNTVINSILFAGAKPLRGKFEDVDKDGDLDLILHFDTKSLQLTPNDTEAILTLTGTLINDALIKGSDSVKIIDK